MPVCAELQAALYRAAILFVASVGISVVVWKMWPPPPSEVFAQSNRGSGSISFEGWLILDARSAEAYAAGHYPGALRLYPAEWDALFPVVLDA